MRREAKGKECLSFGTSFLQACKGKDGDGGEWMGLGR